MIESPAEAIAFINRLEQACRPGRNIYIDLAGVTTLTSDAVVVLISRLSDSDFTHGASFNGNEPLAEEPRALLSQSGFYEFVRSARFREPAADGRIRRKASQLVEERVADELVAFATTRMFGQPENRRSAYATLIECMANTHEHSSKAGPGVNFWWAHVYCAVNSKRAFFCVVDNGVGIFRSVTVRDFRRRFQEYVGLSGNAALFRDWMEGRIEMPSRTSQRNRGKGILDIRKRVKARKHGMTRVVVVANDVYADLADDRYVTLPVSFSGTIVYWELEA